MANRFWVGNSGNWTDTAHWSATSGGAGGVSAPTISDAAILDVNSFSIASQTLTINTNVAALSFTCTGVNASTVLLSGASSKLTVAGSFILDATLILTTDTGLSSIILSADSGSFVIDQAGAVIKTPNLTLSASSLLTPSTWTLSSDLHLESFNGSLSAGSGTWTISGIDSSNLMYFAIATGGAGSNPVVNAETSTIIFEDLSVSIFSAGFDVRIPVAFNAVIISGTMSISSTQNLSFNSLTLNPGITVDIYPDLLYTIGNFSAIGTALNPIVLVSDSPGTQYTLLATTANVSYVDVTDSHASGDVPFQDIVGGVDGGNNTNWCFPDHCSQQKLLFNVQLSFQDTEGDVQLTNVGFSDNTVPIYYELETQEINFGNRMHWHTVSDQLTVFTQFGANSTIEAYPNGELKEIPMTLERRVNIGQDVNLAGNYISFRWFGQTSTTTPIFEGLYIEDINDYGMTKP